MCSLSASLVTSLEFQPIRCATMLCCFGRTRNGYVATQFILLSSTAESSAISGYVVVPERFGQNEEPASRNEERTGKNLVCSQQWIQSMQHVNTVTMNFIHPFIHFNLCISFISGAFFSDFLLWKTCLIFYL